MNADKMLIIFVLIPFFSFAQKEDAYFIIENNNPNYVIFTSTGAFNNKTILTNLKSFELLSRKDYENRGEKMKKKKIKNSTIDILYAEGGRSYIHSWDFNVISTKTRDILQCDLKKLRLVDFKWLRRHSWKENNKNIVFKDLYFLIKNENNKYLAIKVGRTVIEY